MGLSNIRKWDTDIYVSLPVIHYKSLNASYTSFCFSIVHTVIWMNIMSLYHAIAWHAIAQHGISRHGALRRDMSQRNGLTSEYCYVSWMVWYRYCWGSRTMFVSRIRNQLNGSVYKVVRRLSVFTLHFVYRNFYLQ